MVDRTKWADATKANRWWAYKVSGGLLSFGVFSHWYGITHTIGTYADLLVLTGALILLAVFGHVTNDFFDHRQDRVVGKSNLREKLGTTQALLLILLTALLSGVLLVSLGGFSMLTLWLIQVLLNVAYSSPPVRLKERGIWATVITGFYERVVPYLMVHELVVTDIRATEDFTELWIMVLPYFLWAYAWECRNHLTGQLADIELDGRTDTSTFAVRHGQRKIRSLIQYVFWVETLCLAFCTVSDSTVFWGVLLSVAGVVLAGWTPKYNSPDSSRRVVFADLVYVSSMPQMMLLTMSIQAVGLIPLFIFVAIAFPNVSTGLMDRSEDRIERIRHAVNPLISYIANHSIYRFRKHVLCWSERRSRTRGRPWLS